MENIVFGSSGFIGKNLQLKLSALYPTSKECNLLNYNSVFNYLNQFKSEKINIINLAAKVAGSLYNKTHNVEMLYDNSLMIMNLAKVIKELNLDCYYLYISSVCAFNNEASEEKEIFIGEPNSNNYGYGTAKKIGISATLSLKIDNPKFCGGVLIPTNIYGEFDQLDFYFAHVIPTIIQKMLKNTKEISILGNPDNVRQFLYVKDLCNIICDFIDWQQNGIYNIVPEHAISIRNLVNTIKKLTNYQGNILFGNGVKDARYICGEKLKELYFTKNKELNFTSLEDGLSKTIDWIKQQ